MRIVYLKPKSSLVTELRSDTLWGLIMTAISHLYPDDVVNHVLESYSNSTPSFLVSSAFPYKYESGKRTLYFPRPLLQNDIEIPEGFTIEKKLLFMQDLKRYKKAKYITQETLEKYLSGTLADSEYFASKTWYNQPEIKEIVVPHNTISRKTWTTLEIDKAGQLFTSQETFMGNEHGLFFLVKGESLEYLDSALRLLGHIGFGGDISTGKGVYDIEFDNDFTITQPADADKFMVLSLYTPKIEEIEFFKHNSQKLAYEPEFRKGHVGRNISKNHEKDAVLMFREGSVFPSMAINIYGLNHKVRSMHDDLLYPIYHYGTAFHLNLKS
jgi:CRISPR type III-A-associated RAMP protein Csm4